MALTAATLSSLLSIEAQLLPAEIRLVEGFINDIRGKKGQPPISLTATGQQFEKDLAAEKAAEAQTPAKAG